MCTCTVLIYERTYKFTIIVQDYAGDTHVFLKLTIRFYGVWVTGSDKVLQSITFLKAILCQKLFAPTQSLGERLAQFEKILILPPIYTT